tara:strand:- start:405 stop:935 length:531 start_codon:yes stop_codon:yes gene_type:complete
MNKVINTLILFLIVKTQCYNNPKVIKKYAKENYKLVPYFAKSYFKTKKLNKYEREELIQEGYIGLMYACRKYDETRGLKFSTYSSYWIKRYFMNYLIKKQKENNISLPLKLEVLPYRDYNREIDLDVLNNNEKEIIKKRFFEKKKVIELAKEYGVSRNTMTNKIKNIIVKLKIMNK